MNAVERLQILGKGFEDLSRNGARVKIDMPIGHLRHESTNFTWAVFKPIPRFQRFMLRWCFGLKYEKG